MKYSFPAAIRVKAVVFCSILLAAGVLVLPVSSLGAPVTLTDNNSVAMVDLDSAAGMNYWSVGGQNQLNQQWFWYRVGGGSQAPINNISAASILYNDANTLVASYASAQFSLTISYILQGGSLGTADILESVRIHNNTGSTLDFHLFQYSDFNLFGTPDGDQVVLGGAGSGFDYAHQWKGLTQIAELINSPVANYGEVGLVPDVLNRLNTVDDLQLSGVDYGIGDVSWALQWDISIAGNGDFDVFKDKKLSIVPIPEPSSVALVALGLGVWGLVTRRRA